MTDLAPVVPIAADDPRLIIRGIHLPLTEALKDITREKAQRLFRKQPRLVRLRIDLEHDRTRSSGEAFAAKGHIEVGGNDHVATVYSEECLKSLDLLIDKLSRMLRRRARHVRVQRKQSPE